MASAGPTWQDNATLSCREMLYAHLHITVLYEWSCACLRVLKLKESSPSFR